MSRPGREWKPFAFGAALIFLFTLAVYWPALQAGFIWDDDLMLTGNGAIKSSRGLFSIWCTTALPDYFPLTSTTLWVEWRLWGMNPLGYHLTNVLLHALSSIVLWRVLRRLGIPAAWLIGLLFAIHPVNVESVAWITERKNTLAMFFFGLTLYAYVRSQVSSVEGSPTPASNPLASSARPHLWYAGSLCFFLMALLSKTSVVMFPFVVLLLGWWQKRRVHGRDLVRSMPFFVLSLVLGLVTFWFQHHRAIAGDIIQTSSFWTRIAAVGWAVWFYLYKALIPLNLSFVYPRWEVPARSLSSWLPLLALLVAAVFLFSRRRTWGRHVLMGLGYFVLMLLPILGLINVYFQRYSLVADHWEYFSIIGVIALLTGGLAALCKRLEPAVKNQTPGSWIQKSKRKSAAPIQRADTRPLTGIFRTIAAIVVLVLALLAFNHARIFANSEILWRDTLKKNPRAWLAHNNLGQILAGRGLFEQAIEQYSAALSIEPDQPEARNNLGSVFLDMGRLDDAEDQFRAVLRISPRFATAVYNLGNLADRRGNHAEAIARYRTALELDPEYPDAHNNLACLLAADGKLEEAVTHFRHAISSKPDYADACNNLGSTLTELGRPLEAKPFLIRAIQLNPNYADACYNLGNALLYSGQPSEALAQYQAALQLKPNFIEPHLKLGALYLQNRDFERAQEHYSAVLRLQPNSAEAHCQMGILFAAQKQPASAIPHYQAALQLHPDWPEALNNLAWIYATSRDDRLRDGNEAVRLADRAATLTNRKSAGSLDTLAAAEAEAGHFALAVTTAEVAADLAANAGQKDLARDILARLEQYRHRHPWRD